MIMSYDNKSIETKTYNLLNQTKDSLGEPAQAIDLSDLISTVNSLSTTVNSLSNTVDNIKTTVDSINSSSSLSSGGGFQAILGDASQNILAEISPPMGTYFYLPGAVQYENGLVYGNYYYTTAGSYMQFFYLNLQTGTTTSIGTISSIYPLNNWDSAMGTELFVYNNNLYFLGLYSNVTYICKYNGGTSWTKTATSRADGVAMYYPESIYHNQDGLYAFGMYHYSTGTSYAAPQGIFKFNFSTNKWELLQTSSYFFNNSASAYGREFPISRKLLVPYGANTSYFTGFIIFNTETNTIEKTIAGIGSSSNYYMNNSLYISPNETDFYWTYYVSSTGDDGYAHYITNLNTGVNTQDSTWRTLSANNTIFYFQGHPFFVLENDDGISAKIVSAFDYLEVAIPEEAKIIIGNPAKNISYLQFGNILLVQTANIGSTTFNSSISIII